MLVAVVVGLATLGPAALTGNPGSDKKERERENDLCVVCARRRRDDERRGGGGVPLHEGGDDVQDALLGRHAGKEVICASVRSEKWK